MIVWGSARILIRVATFLKTSASSFWYKSAGGRKQCCVSGSETFVTHMRIKVIFENLPMLTPFECIHICGKLMTHLPEVEGDTQMDWLLSYYLKLVQQLCTSLVTSSTGLLESQIENPVTHRQCHISCLNMTLFYQYTTPILSNLSAKNLVIIWWNISTSNLFHLSYTSLHHVYTYFVEYP